MSSTIEEENPALAAAAARELETLKLVLDVNDLKQVDPNKLRTLSEEFVVTLQTMAPTIGLKKPALESDAQ